MENKRSINFKGYVCRFKECGTVLFCLFLFSNLVAQAIAYDVHPGPRWGHVLIYDEANSNLMLFGGTRGSNGGFLNDTWVWNKGKWQKMQGRAPSRRAFSAAAYDKGRNAIVLHGGRGKDGTVYSDLWEWNGKTWEAIEQHSGFCADHHQMVYLERSKTLLAYGGWNGKGVSGDTWLWSKGWQKLKIPSPPKRASFAMVYDNIQDKVLLYGGLWINGQYADIWEFKHGNWQQCGKPYDNSSLDHHNMIFDQKHQKVIGFGGKDYRFVNQKATFSIVGDGIMVLNALGPKERYSAGFTYHAKEGCAYLYGGKTNANGAQIALQDFWQWDGAKWNKISKEL